MGGGERSEFVQQLQAQLRGVVVTPVHRAAEVRLESVQGSDALPFLCHFSAWARTGASYKLCYGTFDAGLAERRRARGRRFK